jgi:cytochrome c peroxidase
MLVELLLTLAIPLGLDLYMPVPDENPLTPEKIELGRQLFFDPRLSRTGLLACGTWPPAGARFADGNPVAIGVDGRRGRRNAPALINRGYGRAFFWDARVTALEEQVVRPIADPNEMGSSLNEAAVRAGYAPAELSRALASFVRSILSGNSRFDRFINGDRDALTSDEQAGLRVFRGKGNCTSCHVGPNLTDERTHNTGVAWTGTGFADFGAGRGEFKTPTLREIEHTGPYMHDGSIGTLEDVVEFYDGGGRGNPSLDAEVRPLRLSSNERRQLSAFLRTLSGQVQFGSR